MINSKLQHKTNEIESIVKLIESVNYLKVLKQIIEKQDEIENKLKTMLFRMRNNGK